MRRRGWSVGLLGAGIALALGYLFVASHHVPSVDAGPDVVEPLQRAAPDALPEPAKSMTAAVPPMPVPPAAERLEPALLKGDHDHLPLIRPGLSEVEALREIADAWREAGSIRQGEPFFEYHGGVVRRMIGDFLERWPTHGRRAELLEIRLRAGERLVGIDRGKDLWAWAQAASVAHGKRVDDAAAALEIARDQIRRVRDERQEGLAVEYGAQLKTAVAGTPAEAILQLESGIALYEAKDFNRARAAFVSAAKTGVGQVRRDALTWLLAIANQWLWQNDMLDAADGLLADPGLPHEERARALFSRAHAFLLLSEPAKSLVDAREVIAQFADTSYANRAKDLVRQAEAKAQTERKNPRQKEGVTFTPAAPEF
jgi:hypothetical protein